VILAMSEFVKEDREGKEVLVERRIQEVSQWDYRALEQTISILTDQIWRLAVRKQQLEAELAKLTKPTEES
jgi:cell division protein FtsB